MAQRERCVSRSRSNLPALLASGTFLRLEIRTCFLSGTLMNWHCTELSSSGQSARDVAPLNRSQCNMNIPPAVPTSAVQVLINAGQANAATGTEGDKVSRKTLCACCLAERHRLGQFGCTSEH